MRHNAVRGPRAYEEEGFFRGCGWRMYQVLSHVDLVFENYSTLSDFDYLVVPLPG